jgi:iron(III) transport system ATP-binding protein
MFYITHDQDEAMALADRIAVMDRGVLMQLATPKELYREPATEMVAEFIGEGLVLPAEIIAPAHGSRCMARILGVDMPVRCRPGQRPAAARLCLRPRELRLAQPGEQGIPSRITRMIYQGGYFRIEARPESAPHLTFILHHSDHRSFEIGEQLSIVLADGWVIPEPTHVTAAISAAA